MWVFLLRLGVAVASPMEDAQAEAVRLSQEIEKLAQRNAWAGVERMFKALEATGVEPSFDTWVAGAHSARASGDVSSARNRLASALTQQEDRQVVDWLSDIDVHFGRVSLACDPTLDASLDIEALPFHPEQRRSIEFAASVLGATCLFDGLLPGGHYSLVWGSYRASFEVKPQVSSVRLDLRGMDPRLAKKKGKQKRREAAPEAVPEGTEVEPIL